MIRINCTFYSECLGRDADLIVLLPNGAARHTGHRYPTLYLLHGLSDSAHSWINRTALERYCDDHALAVVLPNGARSFYCDMAYGDAFYTHISREVPDFCEAVFPVTTDAAYRYIAGNSMGGYGACKIALKNPGRFAKVGTLSGVMEIQDMVDKLPLRNDWTLCFGGNTVPEQEELFFLLRQARKDSTVPQLFHYCGTDDFLAEENRHYCELCRELDIPLTSHWEKNGCHEWEFWDLQLPHLLDWLEAPSKPT